MNYSKAHALGHDETLKIKRSGKGDRDNGQNACVRALGGEMKPCLLNRASCRRGDFLAACAPSVMGCCFCCLGQSGKVSQVVEGFPLVPIRAMEPGNVVQAVGFAAPNTTTLRAPMSGRNCVWYRLKVTQHWTERKQVGDHVHELQKRSVVRDEERGVDFWLVDGPARAFVQASVSARTQIHSWSTRQFGTAPQAASAGGGHSSAHAQAGGFAVEASWGASPQPLLGTNVRYVTNESTIEVGEKCGCVGAARREGKVLVLKAVNPDSITDAFMARRGWTAWQRRAWSSLTRGGAVILHNHPRVRSIFIRPASTLALSESTALPRAADEFYEAKELKIGTMTVIPKERVSIKRELGRGNFGVAFLAAYNGGDVVVKVPKVARPESDFQELSAFMLLSKHPNILTLIGMTECQGKMSFVTEHCSLGSLDTLHHKIDLSEGKRFRRVLLDTCRGLEHLHKIRIVQRDLACRNLLMKADGRVLIADWGLSRRLNASGMYRQGHSATAWPWCAPESLRKGLFSPASDVWMLGVTCFEMLTRGGDPYDWHNRDRVTATAAIADGRLVLSDPRDATPFALGIMRSCVSFEPTDRPTAQALITALEQSDLGLLRPTDSTPSAPPRDAPPPDISSVEGHGYIDADAEFKAGAGYGDVG